MNKICEKDVAGLRLSGRPALSASSTAPLLLLCHYSETMSNGKRVIILTKIFQLLKL